MGGRIIRLAGLVPAPYRQLPIPTRALIVGGFAALAGLSAQVLATAPPHDTFWIRALLTFAASMALVMGLGSIRGTTGRVRAVRSWITLAMALWLIGELVRNAEVAAGIDMAPSPSDLPFIGVLACAALAYAAALRGQLRPGEELAVYLDGGIVFFATAALMLTTFGETASRTPEATVDLAYAIFFLATTGATLLLDLAVRAERRLHGAYVVLVGLILLGAGFLVRLAAPPAAGLHEAGPPAYLLSLGVVLVSLGTVTWTDLMDCDPAYVRLATRLRSAMPLVAVGLTPVLMVAHVVRGIAGPIGVMNVIAIGLVLVTVAIRQSVLLRDREAAVRREQALGRELSTAERKYRSLVERQPGAVYIAESGPTGRWHFVSPQIEAMLGYPAEEWTADPELWAKSIHPEDRAGILAADSIAAEPGAAKRFEYRVVTRDGRTVWVLDDIAITEAVDGVPLLQGLLLDITPAKLAEEALRASEEQQRMIIETASYAFVAIDSTGVVVEWNRQAEDTFGWSRDDALGTELAELVVPESDRAAHREGIRRYAATGEGRILSRRLEMEAVHRDGHFFPVELTVWPVQHGSEIRFNALIQDITARKDLEEQLRHQALHDSLTGLANRALFTDRLQHALDRSSRSPESSLAVLFLDLDDFKTVNDSLGHSEGDALLVAVARRLERSLRAADTPARLGGDEFAVLIEDVDAEGPHASAARLLNAFKRPFRLHDKEIQVQASIGVAVSGSPPATPGELLRNADLAMYVAKQRGKARYEVYEQRMHDDALRRLQLKAGLERAIADELLEVHYQPIVQLEDGALVGFEALLRWRDAEGQFVPVAELISLAEETGLIVPIGRFVLREACLEAREWSTRGGESIHVAVNVSAQHLQQGSLVRDVRDALKHSGLHATALVVEITESASIYDNVSALRELRQLRKLGVRLSLDDFGTGYSSLGRLRHLPFGTVKIDRSFVSRITAEHEGAVVQSILELATTMGLDVIAEGIETSAQLVALKARGCKLGQGYYFARPMPVDALPAVVEVGHLPLPRRRLHVVSARGA